jgi:hypothetical protein
MVVIVLLALFRVLLFLGGKVLRYFTLSDVPRSGGRCAWWCGTPGKTVASSATNRYKIAEASLWDLEGISVWLNNPTQ